MINYIRSGAVAFLCVASFAHLSDVSTQFVFAQHAMPGTGEPPPHIAHHILSTHTHTHTHSLSLSLVHVHEHHSRSRATLGAPAIAHHSTSFPHTHTPLSQPPHPLPITRRCQVIARMPQQAMPADPPLLVGAEPALLVGADIPVQLSSGSTQVVFAQNSMPGAGPSVAAIPLPLQLAASHLVHLPPLQPLSKYNCRLPILYIASASNPLLSPLTFLLPVYLSLSLSLSPTPHDVVAVLPADSKDAGAAPPVPVAFADRPTAAPLASPTAVPPPAYSLPAAARAPRPDATRPAVVFAQNALPGAGTPVAATTTAGFQSYTCASTAIPPQLNLPPSNLLLSSYTPSLHPHLHIFYIELHSSPNLSTRQYQLIGTVPLSLSRPPILSHIPLSLCPKWRCSLPGTVTISLT